MNEEIDKLISNFDTCQELRFLIQKSPCMKHPSQHSTWEMVATDLFHWDNNDYLLVVYYLSRYIEISKLPNTLSKTVIAHTKSILARHGIRVKVRSDNGPQNVSQEYKQFASS